MVYEGGGSKVVKTVYVICEWPLLTGDYHNYSWYFLISNKSHCLFSHWNLKFTIIFHRIGASKCRFNSKIIVQVMIKGGILGDQINLRRSHWICFWKNTVKKVAGLDHLTWYGWWIFVTIENYNGNENNESKNYNTNCHHPWNIKWYLYFFNFPSFYWLIFKNLQV